MKWYVVENDILGGHAVSNLNLPISQHDLRQEGDPAKRGYVIADFVMTPDDAAIIAHMLNLINYTPLALGIEGSGWWSDAKVQTNAEGLSTE